ncbi:hypothetical protein [Clostridium saccharoperbutylacetonicum]|uniref:hypothetical protein n=1 Tax=Clostridium saccharoperbutylacetonicum TaxID=36745 RepID=UPI000983C9FA|nr:hypothetical protein [Clostridium saccharoperbutylacetonicum]AQR96145.1 hypothetical protein CLSAP_34640 [Clostridium saccharoperbutylacetonicum]NSB32015.1 hypothetical protein [Clostridium saccharoperbutylacetonicum]
MMSLRKILFKILFNKESLQLDNFLNKENEKEKLENDTLLNLAKKDKTFKEQTKYLSDMLYRALNNTIKMSIDSSSNELSYTLKDYFLSYYNKTLKLIIERNGDQYIFIYSISNINVNYSDDNEEVIISKVHITLDSIAKRLYIHWNRNINVPVPNPKYEIEKKIYPYEKYQTNTCEYHLEHDKYHFAKDRKTSEKYLNDKSHIKIGLLHIEADYNNQNGYVYVYDESGRTGFISYTTHISPNAYEPDYIHIDDNMHGEELENKNAYGNHLNSTRRLGRGSAAIDMLIEYAVSNNFKYIDGSLSSKDERDIQEKEWRNTFYKHKGFKIEGRKIKKII